MERRFNALKKLHLVLSVLTLALLVGGLSLMLFVPCPWGLAKNHEPGHILIVFYFLEGFSKNYFTEEELPIAILVLSILIIALVLIVTNMVLTFKKGYGTARKVICLSATVSLVIAAVSVFVLTGPGYLCSIPAVFAPLDGFLFLPKEKAKTI
jgi:hypothetical protein